MKTSVLVIVAVLAPVVAQAQPVAARARPVAATIHLPERFATGRGQVLEEALSRALTGLRGASAVPPERTFSLLARDPRGMAARRQAADLLANAIVLVDRLRYPQAVEVLSTARADAVTGLAQLVEPKLLADIDLQLGVVRHVMQDRRARTQLVHSFAVFPGRSVEARGRSPKVVQALREAALRARRSRPPLPTVGEMRRAAALTGADGVVLVTPLESTAALEVVDVRVFQGHSWGGGRKLVWPAGAPVSEVASRLTRALRALVGEEPVVEPAGRGKQPYAWLATGLAAALAGAGAALFVVSNQRIEEAESLATTPPSVEYADRAQGLEESARRLRTGAIVTLSLAGAATVGALVLWLSSGPTERGAEQRIAPWRGGVVVRF